MSLACKLIAFAAVLCVAIAALAAPPLKVCADPSDLPFSNMRQQGFENELAQWVGRDLGREIQYEWWPQQARFVEKRLKAQMCDLVMGTVAGNDLLMTTRPYYRSGYVFVSRAERNIEAASLTDGSLKKYRVGAQLIGDDDALVPPAQEMARHGLLNNLVGYSLYGHPTQENPTSEIITAVEKGDVDMAIAWGPLAGYFQKHSTVPLKLTPICELPDKGAQPFEFDISMGVKRSDDQLLAKLNDFIDRHQKQIRDLLESYGVPLMKKGQIRPECNGGA